MLPLPKTPDYARMRVTVILNNNQAACVMQALALFINIGLGRFEVIATLLRDRLIRARNENADALTMAGEIDVLMRIAKRSLGFDRDGSYTIDDPRVSDVIKKAYALKRAMNLSLRQGLKDDTADHKDVEVAYDVMTGQSHIHMAGWHAQALVKALDFYTRMGLGQIDELEHLIRSDVIRPVRDDVPAYTLAPDVDALTKFVKRMLGHSNNSSFGIGHQRMSPDAQRAYEIQKQVEQSMAVFTDPNPKFKGVNYDGRFISYTDDPDITVVVYEAAQPQNETEGAA